MLKSWTVTGLGVATSWLLLAGCVPATRYEEAQSALGAERTAHRRTLSRAYHLQRQLADTHAVATAHAKRLEEHEQKLAATNLDAKLAGSARDNAMGTVEQLRSELARAGDHLRAFSQEKQELVKALAAATARSENTSESAQLTADRANLVRDISLTFHDKLAAGSYELTFGDGRPVLLVPMSAVLNGDQLSPGGQELVRKLGEFLALHADAKLVVSVDGADSARVKQLREQLTSRGLSAQHVTFNEATAATGEKTAGASQLRVEFQRTS
ncbi:MAG TPA: hypothetical protein VI072_00900 [Polyangiaceae bacterium]